MISGMKEEVISAWADEDIEIGDAVYFTYYNYTTEVTPPGPHARLPLTSGGIGRTVHGTAVSSGSTGELISVRLATATTINIRCTWTAILTPGTAIYPGSVAGAMSTDDEGIPSNQLGIYVGADSLPVSDSGSIIEVMVTRVAPHIDI
jgi:hypothetical protein